MKINYLDIQISPVDVTLTKPFFEKISLYIFNNLLRLTDSINLI